MAGATAGTMTHRYNLALPEVYRDRVSGEAALVRRGLVTLASSDWAAPDDDASVVLECYELPEERALCALEKGVHKCLDLKYPLRLEDYSLIVRALIRGAVSQSIELGLRSKLCRAAARLLSKRECEIPGGIPWRTLADAIMREHVECMHGAPFTGRDVRENHCRSLVNLFGKVIFYLPEEDTAEVVWGAFIEKVREVESDPDTAYLAFMLMSYILPTRGEQWTGWTKEGMDLLESVESSPYWDALWASMFARTAKHQPNTVDWDQCITTSCSRISLSVWDCRLARLLHIPPLKRHCPRHCFFLTHADPLDSTALFTAYALSPLQPTTRMYLERFINLIENYCHPSNSGRWSSSIASFLQYLTHALMLRVSAERARDKGWSHRSHFFRFPQRCRRPLGASFGRSLC